MLACVVFFTTAQKSWLVNGFFLLLRIFYLEKTVGEAHTVLNILQK